MSNEQQKNQVAEFRRRAQVFRDSAELCRVTSAAFNKRLDELADSNAEDPYLVSMGAMLMLQIDVLKLQEDAAMQKSMQYLRKARRLNRRIAQEEVK